MGSVSGSREHVAAAPRHKVERYRSFVRHQWLDDEYLKSWTYSNATMGGNRRSFQSAWHINRSDTPGLVIFGSGKCMGIGSGPPQCDGLWRKRDSEKPAVKRRLKNSYCGGGTSVQHDDTNKVGERS